MGCSSSTEAAAAPSTSAIKKEDKTLPSSSKTATVALSSKTPSRILENNPKVEHSETDTTKATASTRVQDLGSLRIRYACLSRRGQDAEDKSKPNQDAYSVQHNFCDENSDTLFGVYDGHGPHGEACAGFVQQRLPDLITHKMKQHTDITLSTDQIQTSMHEAHTRCNKELHASKHIDDSSSGTTSITMYLQGEQSRITICNVGDSRAVLGTQTQSNSGSGGGLRAVSLSTDHTPHRSDEAERCIQSGARILTFGQISPHDDDDSDTEDPPRVWAKNGTYPGTAFTRSIGDAVAEKLGVTAEPEMLSLKISPKEKVIVLASDGIFDVMTNQEVIDMCYQFYNKGPAHACRAVVENSYREWLIGEDCLDNEEAGSYDDMTITCIFVYDNDHDFEAADEQKSHSAETDATQLPLPTKPPHRRKRARQKTLRHLDEQL